MLHKTRAIVLHHIKYGESSLIVTLYTEQYGRIACIVNGVRTKRSKLPVTLFQPLTLLEIDYYYRQNRDLQRLKEASCTIPYHSIPYNISKSTIALFLAEVLYLTLREEESNSSLFSFIFHALQLLDNKDDGSSNFHLWFMLHFSRFLGFFPPEQDIPDAESISSDLQVFYSMPATAVAALRLLVANPQGPPDKLNMGNQDRNLLLERIIRYYALHVEGFSRLKSFTILQEVFR